MTSREPFVHAVASPSVRRDIAQAVASGIPVEQLAEEFNISPSTVRSYAREWEGVQRKVQCLSEFECEAIVDGVARGSRRRWERTYGTRVVAAVVGES